MNNTVESTEIETAGEELEGVADVYHLSVFGTCFRYHRHVPSGQRICSAMTGWDQRIVTEFKSVCPFIYTLFIFCSSSSVRGKYFIQRTVRGQHEKASHRIEQKKCDL